MPVMVPAQRAVAMGTPHVAHSPVQYQSPAQAQYPPNQKRPYNVDRRQPKGPEMYGGPAAPDGTFVQALPVSYDERGQYSTPYHAQQRYCLPPTPVNPLPAQAVAGLLHVFRPIARHDLDVRLLSETCSRRPCDSNCIVQVSVAMSLVSCEVGSHEAVGVVGITGAGSCAMRTSRSCLVKHGSSGKPRGETIANVSP